MGAAGRSCPRLRQRHRGHGAALALLCGELLRRPARAPVPSQSRLCLLLWLSVLCGFPGCLSCPLCDSRVDIKGLLQPPALAAVQEGHISHFCWLVLFLFFLMLLFVSPLNFLYLVSIRFIFKLLFPNWASHCS